MNALAGLIAALHVYVFYLESIAWMKPRTRGVFGMSKEQAGACRGLALNQGFYNLFLSLGIGWGLLRDRPILVDYGVASAGAAGLVLLLSARHLWRPALVQLLPALAYGLIRAIV